MSPPTVYLFTYYLFIYLNIVVCEASSNTYHHLLHLLFC